MGSMSRNGILLRIVSGGQNNQWAAQSQQTQPHPPPQKKETLNPRCLNVGTASTTLAQH